MNDKIRQTLNASYELGKSIYELLISKAVNGTDVIISPKHIGDTIFLCAFIHEYKYQHSCEKVLMVVPESQKELIHMFPSVDMFLALDIINMEALQNYICIEQKWRENHVIYAHAKAKVELSEDSIVFTEEYELDTMLQSTFFFLDISEDSKPERMILKHGSWNKDLNNKYSNSVLIMPGAYTYSVDAIPLDFWKKLICNLKDKGYCVYLNYNNKECDVLIDGAEPLSTSFTELVELSRYFKAFIGIRSGICDLLAETNAKLIALYPMSDETTGIAVSEVALETDSLYYLGRHRNIWNYQFNRKLEEDLIDCIFKDIEM